VSSIVTNDFPADWLGFNACADRHLGQQNLNVVQQGTTFEFNIHLVRRFRDADLTLSLRHDVDPGRVLRPAPLGRYLVADRLATIPGLNVARFERPPAVGARLNPARVAADVRGEGPTAVTGRLAGRVPLAPLAARELNRWSFRSTVEREALQVEIPQLGLRPNEALPLELTLTDRATGQVVGGITLLVVG
jgi:hypothetical protein